MNAQSKTKMSADTQPLAMGSAPSTRTGQGLRDVLFDEIDKLRDGTGNPTQAIAVAKLACQIVNIVKVEVEYQRHLRSMKPGEENPQPMETIQLGSL